MAYREFTIDLKEARSLNTAKTIIKMPIYGVISMVDNCAHVSDVTPKLRSPVAKFGGMHVAWKTCSPMHFNVDETRLQQNNLFLKIQLLQKRILFNDRVIRELVVPLKELYDNNYGGNFYNLQLCNLVKPSKSKKEQGLLYFKFKFGDVTGGSVNEANGMIIYPTMQT